MSSLIVRIVFVAILCLLLPRPEGMLTAQSSPDPGQDTTEHTISFSFGDYDVISSIYVFLSSGTQQATCTMEVTSIQKRGLLGWLLPSPISLDLLFRSAAQQHHAQGHIPCNVVVDDIPLTASLSNPQGLQSILFTVFSLLHLNDQWGYSVQCQQGGNPLISFLTFL